MLPFLAPKKSAGIIIAKRKPDGEIMPENEEGEASPALMSCAEDLISAIHAKDASAVASALDAAYSVLDVDDMGAGLDEEME